MPCSQWACEYLLNDQKYSKQTLTPGSLEKNNLSLKISIIKTEFRPKELFSEVAFENSDLYRSLIVQKLLAVWMALKAQVTLSRIGT